MDGDLVCNFKKCRKQIRSFAWVTSCSHVFCDEDGSREFNKSLTCPACDTTLSGKFDIIRSDVQPSEQWKSMVIAGQRPEVIMEICTRALSFWTYQVRDSRTREFCIRTRERQDAAVPFRKMKILNRFHLDRIVLVLCCVFGTSLLLTYQKLLNDQHLEHRRFKQRELFQILDNHRLSKESQDDRASMIGDWRAAGGRSSLAMRSIKRSYDEEDNESTVPDMDVNKNKYLIYLCNRQKFCGNWEDRQAGIVSTFILANLTKRIFKVSMTSPCRLQNFLIPKEYNWIPDIDELRGKPFAVISDDRNSTFLQTLQVKDFNTVYSQDTIFIRATTDFARIVTHNPFYKDKLSKWMLQNDQIVFKNAWNMLMTPSEYVENTLSEIGQLNSIPGFRELTCVYVETENVTISYSVYQEFIGNIFDSFAGKAAKVFIATDSNEFRNMTRTKFGVNCLDSGGAIMDIDKERFFADSCSALETVILDQLILTQCYVLVISKSSFGETTAVLRGTNSNLFTFRNGTISPFNYTV